MGIFLNKNQIKLSYFQRCRYSNMRHIFFLIQRLKFGTYLQDPKKHVRISQYFKSYDILKNGNLGRSLHFAASLSDIRSNAPSSETHNSRVDSLFVTIRRSTIIFMSRPFIWAIKTAYQSVYCGETDRWQKYPDRKSVNMENNYTEN